jgi:hypothetical protein
MVLHAPRGPGGPPVQSPGCGAAGNRRSVGHPASEEARKGRVVARPLFENSTACRKSVPSNTPCRNLQGSGLGFLWLIDIASVSSRFSAGFEFIYGEFDPGSGRTLAACLTHASRTVNSACGGISGERVSNTWATCPRLWDNSKKLGLIPDMTADRMVWWWKDLSAGDGPAAYQLVGGVVAYQGDDG